MENHSPISFNISSEEILNHSYYNQVVLDVKRILKRFPPGNGINSHTKFVDIHVFLLFVGLSDSIQADLQVRVTDLIVKVLIVNDGYHYYQVCISTNLIQHYNVMFFQRGFMTLLSLYFLHLAKNKALAFFAS